MRFILHCNPAVPPETDTAALREAFQTPPKSGGKTFDTFTLFELIKRLEARELKTWAELALKLGVEPPDADKGQSSQKIQQYAVRLKRWMHSMHVDAFFEYLLHRDNSYWTEIPSDAARNPVCETGRDGVAAEDDMALRALLPHIRPRRGRRKPDEEDGVGKSPSRRPSMEPPPLTGDDFAGVRSAVTDGWSAHPEGRGSVFLFPMADPLRLNPGAGQAWTGGSDVLQTPLTAYPQSAYPQTAYPQSAITPSTRQAFWADEPKSAVTPSKARMNKRHGAKVVSSAWRSGLGGTGKTRGRPKINRGEGEGNGPFSAFPGMEGGGFKIPGVVTGNQGGATPISALPTLVESPVSMMAGSAPPTPTVNPNIDPNLSASTPTGSVGQEANPNPRPVKRSRLSLQVPERVGGEVRLATPPPVVMVNGTPTSVDHQQPEPNSTPTTRLVQQPTAQPSPSSNPFPPPQQQPLGPGLTFSNPTDRTNLDETEAFFAHEILTADWFDSSDNPIPPCGVEEAWAIVKTIIEDVMKAAPTRDAFLINMAALAGGRMLMGTTRLRVTRVEEGGERSRYRCDWELRLGDVRGGVSMEQTVECGRWRKGDAGDGEDGERDGEGEGGGETEEKKWQRKYMDMCETVRKRDKQLSDLRVGVVQALKYPRGE